MAGGTDLMVQMKVGHVRPSVVVDAKNVPELNRLEWCQNKTLHIGAAVPLRKIVIFPPVIERFGILHQACSLVGSVQIRNPLQILPPIVPLLCLGAKAVVAQLGGTRVVPLESSFLGPAQTVSADNELLVEIEIPIPPTFSTGCYLPHTPGEEMDIGILGVASFLVFAPKGNRC